MLLRCNSTLKIKHNKNHDIAIAMSSSPADPVLGTGIEYSTGLTGGI